MMREPCLGKDLTWMLKLTMQSRATHKKVSASFQGAGTPRSIEAKLIMYGHLAASDWVPTSTITRVIINCNHKVLDVISMNEGDELTFAKSKTTPDV